MLCEYEIGCFTLELNRKNTTLLGHLTPRYDEYSRLSGCPKSLDHYIVLFVALTLSSFGIGKAFFSAVAGWSELLIALLSFYAAGAAVLNKHLGYEFVPLGKPFGILKPAA